jgi:MYXO-CTERM domain-containing protein
MMVGAAMTTRFLLEESPWLLLALLVVAALIAWARRSSNSILVDILRR